MAEVEKCTSGSAGRKDKCKQKGRPKKSTSKQQSEDTVIVDTEKEMTCAICKSVFVDEDDKLLECERCNFWFCISCAGMDPAVYVMIGKNKNLHWFCKECEKPALTAVRSDKEIEEKCAAYMSKVTERIVAMEEKIEEKADKSVVESLQERVNELEKRDNDSGKGIQPDTVHETIVEQRERELRVRNLIIQNLPESGKNEIEDRIAEDKQSVKDMLSAIGIDEEELEIERCSRVGVKEEGKVRITKISVSKVESKRDILMCAKKLINIEKYKKVYICPDLTKMQRDEQFQLREKLRELRSQGAKDIFIRGRRIIHAKDRAVQFRGGAPESAKE